MLDTAVIPCGGLGRRLQPITRWLPKEMLPVGLKPLLFHALDEIADAGLLRAVIVTNPHKPMVEAAARHWHGPLELEFVPQPQPRGVGHALACARDLLGGAPFAVVLTDQLHAGSNALGSVIAAYRATRLPALLVHRYDDATVLPHATIEPISMAAAADRSLRVTDVTDRSVGRRAAEGATESLAAGGRFVLPGGIFSEFDAAERSLAPWAELSHIPALQRLAWRGELAAALYDGQRYDCAVPEGYRSAVTDFPVTA